MSLKQIGIGASVVGLLVVAGFFVFSPKETQKRVLSEYKVTRGDIANETLVFGKAAPSEVYELSFDVSGKLTEYNFDEGQSIGKNAIIAKLDSRTVRSQISRANSAVAIERSRFSDLSAPVSQQDQTVKQTEIAKQALVVEGAQVDFDNAIDNALEEYRDLLDREVDGFYLYPTRSDALLRLKDADDLSKTDRERLSQVRVDLEELYKQTVATSDTETTYALVRALFDSTESLAQDISTQLAKESSLGAEQTRDDLEDFVDDIDNLYDSLNSSFVSWNTAKSSLNVLEKQLVSLQAGADTTALQLQQSVINSKRSDLNALYTDLSKLTLRSPITGIVFDAPLVNYQTVSPGQVVLSVIPDEPLVVKAQVAESDVQFIGPGNMIEVSFDALTDKLFTGSVLEVNNRENTNSAVPTYETTFVFDGAQGIDAVRSGMTANIRVSSGNRTGVLYVPLSYLTQEEGASYVITQTQEGVYEKTSVSVGVRTTSGLVEITNGLSEGQVVYVTN